jgi:tripartite-type tricarboxylate transporter receptor subunit TctC
MSVHVLNGALYSLPYDLINDFVPIAPLYRVALMIVGRKTFPAKDLHELIAWLKTNPNKASLGVAIAAVRLLATYFQQQTGTQFALVPYRGNAPAMQDLLAGEIDLLFDAPRSSVPLVRAGGIKGYAVTSDKRLALVPDIPTFAEIGLPGLSYSEWLGLFAPKGTPRDIIDKLNAAAVEAMADPAVRSRITDFGSEIYPREQQTPEALAALQKADAEKWWPIIKEFGFKAEWTAESGEGHSLPIDPYAYVRFDQQRTWAELWNRRDGPMSVISANEELTSNLGRHLEDQNVAVVRPDKHGGDGAAPYPW